MPIQSEMVKLTICCCHTAFKFECISIDKMYMDFHYMHSTVFEYWIAIPTPLDGSRRFKTSSIKRTVQSSSQQTKKTLLFLEMWRILKNWCTPLLNSEEVLSTIEDFFLPLMLLCLCPMPNLLMLWMPGFQGEGKRYFSIAVDSVRTNYFSDNPFVGGNNT